MTKQIFLSLMLNFLLLACALAGAEGEDLLLEAGVPVFLAADAPGAVRRAAEDLQRDLQAIFGEASPLVHDPAVLAERACIVVRGPADAEAFAGAHPLAGPEAHRVFVGRHGDVQHLVAQGADVRGTIYAIYTVSEQILGVPPLWIWASWQPEARSQVRVPPSTDLRFAPADVRWRAWFPNDMDYYQPWTRQPPPATEPIDTADALHETMLRLKLNALDVGGIMNAAHTGLTQGARDAAARGLVVLSTHTAALGARLDATRWENYWDGLRGMAVPELSLDHEDALFAYWQHAIDTILESGIETIWTVTFRGHGDVPFWERMAAAPESDAERAQVIERIVRRQVEQLTASATEAPLMRVTMYNEISDYFLDGLLRWPERPDLIWNFTAARRDHYPPWGTRAPAVPARQPLGYYLNLQFTSTGSHVAQGEGPWKMAANFHAVDALQEAPLEFAIVNAGNIREFVMELSAHAAMMWDFADFDAGRFLEGFAGTCFGAEAAGRVAALYADFYEAYWEQQAPAVPGFTRQYVFHDLRHGRAMRDILRRLQRGETTEQPLGNGFADLSFYQIAPGDTGADTIREALEVGTAASSARWAAVVAEAEALLPEIAPAGQRFFQDNLLVQARFMQAIAQSLHALSVAVSPELSLAQRQARVGEAQRHFLDAREALREAEHGYFAGWYPGPGQRDIFRFHAIEAALGELVEGMAVTSEIRANAETESRGTPGAWALIESFGQATPGASLASAAGWSVRGDAAAFEIVQDPQQEDNHVLLQRGGAVDEHSSAWVRLPEAFDAQGTLFFRQFIEPLSTAPGNRQAWQLGLNSAAQGGGANWWEYAVRKEIDFSEHRARDDRAFSGAMLPFAWHNFWFVVDREAETLRVYRTQGADVPGEDELLTVGGFREAAPDLSVLKLSRSATARDWQAYFDDFHAAPGVNLRLPEAVLAAAPEATNGAWVEGTGTWTHEGREHGFQVSASAALAGREPLPTVIYLKHLPIPRLGTETDEMIVADLLAEDLVVVEVDCTGLPAESPGLERALLAFYQQMGTLLPAVTQGRINPHDRQTYWLPEGYRLARDLPFWHIARHGAHGTLERIVQTHNSQIVERHGVEPVERPEALRGPDGARLDYNLHLDLMYPSGRPAAPAPVIAHFATLSHRPASFRRDYRPMEPLGWLLDGYALAYVDHVYNPLARHENYGHFEPGYTLESTNGVAAGSAAIRFLRANAFAYNLSDRIGALGHSKSSYTVVRIADPRHPEQPEHSTFSGFPQGSPRPQPNARFSSRVDAAFASMGTGTRRTQYFTRHMAPTVVAVGRHDHFNHWDVFPRLVATCEEADMLHLALWMEEMGHDRPFGEDLATGEERNLLIRRFFAQHLHPHGREALEVLYMLPRADRAEVPLDGVTRVLTTDEELPDNMRGLSPLRPITVRFARSIVPGSVTPENLRVLDADTGEAVAGSWAASFEDSRFQFRLEQPLRPHSRYEIQALPGIRDTAGRTLAAVHSQFFETGDAGSRPQAAFVAAPPR